MRQEPGVARRRILLGWGVALVAGSFSAHGEMVGQSLMDGQLYFTGQAHLLGALALLVIGTLCMSWLSQRLLMDRFFPDYFSANGIPAWRHRLAFDWLVVAIVAVATTAFGVMAAFALLFIPAWVAWGVAQGWRNVLIIAAGLAVVAYVIAFVVAVAVDQPFGPMLVLVLCATALLRFARRGIRSASPSAAPARAPSVAPEAAHRK